MPPLRFIAKLDHEPVHLESRVDYYDFTAMARIITIRAIVRSEGIRKNPLYFLAGTTVNSAYSVQAYDQYCPDQDLRGFYTLEIKHCHCPLINGLVGSKSFALKEAC